MAFDLGSENVGVNDSSVPQEFKSASLFTETFVTNITPSSHQKSDLSPSQTVGKEASPPPHEAAINPDRPTQQKATPTKSNSIKFNVYVHPTRSE